MQSSLDFPSLFLLACVPYTLEAICLRSLYTGGRMPVFSIDWRPCACVSYTLEALCLCALYTGVHMPVFPIHRRLYLCSCFHLKLVAVLDLLSKRVSKRVVGCY